MVDWGLFSMGARARSAVGGTFLVVAVVACATSSPWAASEIREVSVTGTGSSAQDAAVNGVIQAVQQVSGMKVKAAKATQIRSEMNRSSNGAKNDASVSKTQKSKVFTATEGLVKSYDVLDSREVDKGLWEVDLLVRVPVYKALGTGTIRAEHMRTMAVLPFRTTKRSYFIGNRNESAAEVSRELSQKLTNQIAQSRRFRLVEREYMAEVLGEKSFIANADVPIEELTRIGQSLGADYLVVGTISAASVGDVTETFGNFKTTSTRGSYAVDYRVIETAPQEIRWADTASGGFDLTDSRTAASSGRQKLFAQAATKIAGDILNVIFPLKVLELQGSDAVLLTQGGIRVKKGTVYAVHGPSRRVIDPDTQVPTRVMGPTIATVKVVSVQPKYSEAKLIDGDFSAISKGAVVTRVGGAGGTAKAKPKIRAIPAASGEAPVNW